MPRVVARDIGRLHRGAFDTLLAVNAEAELDFGLAKLEARFPGQRHGAGAERHA